MYTKEQAIAVKQVLEDLFSGKTIIVTAKDSYGKIEVSPNQKLVSVDIIAYENGEHGIHWRYKGIASFFVTDFSNIEVVPDKRTVKTSCTNGFGNLVQRLITLQDSDRGEMWYKFQDALSALINVGL